MTPPLRPVPSIPSGQVGTREAMALMATSQIGYREGPSNDTIFGAMYGMNFVSWCAEFLSVVARLAKVPTAVIPNYAYTPSGQQWFASKGRLHTTPEPGDIGFVYFSSLGRVGHTFLVLDVWTTEQGALLMHTCEGNTNDTGSSQGIGVFRLIRADTSNLTYGRPDYAPSLPSGEGESEFPLPPPVQEDDMPMFTLIADHGRGGPQWLVGPLTCRPVSDKEKDALVKAGLVKDTFIYLETADFDALKAGFGMAIKNVAVNVDTALADDFAAIDQP